MSARIHATVAAARAAIACALLMFVSLALDTSADVPRRVSAQGQLANSVGIPAEGTFTMVFKLYDVESGGAALWSEAQSVAVAGGVYSVVLGDVTPLTLAFDVPYFLGITVGTDAEMTPRRALSSVPYAFASPCTPGDRLDCYTGTGTPGVGLCATGIRSCNASSSWGTCAGQVTPNCGTACLNFQTNVDNCGSCGLACQNPHGTRSCTGGACTPTCSAGWARCGSTPLSAGCTTPLNTNTNCNGCGVQCSRANATATCSTQSCQIQSCNPGWANADGNDPNGCERNLNGNPICQSATLLDPVSGDTGAVTQTINGIGEEWLRIQVTEDNSDVFNNVYLSARVQLVSPPGADYDLYVYCASCGTGVAASSTSGELGGTDTVFVRKNDFPFTADDFTIFIEVRWFGGTSNSNWSLSVTGNAATSTVTCN